jgi:hypothetical protein
MGLVIVAVSYEGTLTLTFTLCPDVVRDSESLESLVHDSLDAIETRAEAAGEAAMDQLVGENPRTLSNEIYSFLEGLLKKRPLRFRR